MEQIMTYSMKMSLYVDYYNANLLDLSKPLLAQGSTLLEGFWPCSNWKLSYAKVELQSTTPAVDSENPLVFPYYGLKNLKLDPTYTPFRDLNNGDFVFVKLHDLFLVPIWLGRTQRDVIKDDQNELVKIVRVQWWVPLKKGQIWTNDICTKIAEMKM
jgi:hypothetical protein